MSNLADKFLFFSLAIVFLWFGGMKFTAYEAEAIQGLIQNHAFLAIFNDMLSDNFLISKIIGSIEILTGVLLALRFIAPTLAMYGALLASLTFITTFSFFFTTPGVFHPEAGSFAISVMPGQFLLKDLALLGASFWAFNNAREA